MSLLSGSPHAGFCQCGGVQLPVHAGSQGLLYNISACRLHYVLVTAEYIIVMPSLHASDDCLLLNVLVSMSLEVQYVPACLSAELSVVAWPLIFSMDLAHFVSSPEAAWQM